MSTEKELIDDLIRKQKDCEFSLRFLLQKDKDGWKNVFAMLKLVKKGVRKEAHFDYGQFVLSEKLLTVNEGLRTISSLFEESDEKRKLIVPEYDEFLIRGRGISRFVPSKQRYGFLRDDWPLRFYEFEVKEDKKGAAGDRELLKEGMPYYPNVYEAVIDFFELAVEHFSSYGSFYLVICDYRARIEFLKLSFSKAMLKLDVPEVKYPSLVIKVFAKAGNAMVTLPDIYPKSESVKFDVNFQPDNLSVALLTRRDNMKIDGKEFAIWREEEEGVFIERPEEEILFLTTAGESQNLEYKQDLIDESNKNDFVETVVAFLNTNGGIILVGVNDKGNIIGSQKTAEDILKLIHDSCDPPPRDVKVEEKEAAGKSLIVVEVPDGQEKPYQSKKDKNFYVRHNASDMKMERSELLAILEESAKQKTPYR